MAPHSSPTVKRRRLAAELRRHRDLAGMTIEHVAEQLEWSSGKISKIENARVTVLPRDVKFLLGVYGVEDGPEREVLLALARESRQRGWWQQFGDAIPEWFEVYVGLEAEATSVSSYHGEYVPGLLQTEDYARAVHQATLVTATEEEIERRVKVRIARQQSLRAPDGPQLWIVLNEAVLRRQVGGRAVMRQQLTGLVDASKAANITLQVLPFSAGAHAAMDSPFRLLEFADAGDPAIVYVEYASGSLYLERPAEVARYRQMIDHLRAASLPVTDSRRLLTTAADELA